MNNPGAETEALRRLTQEQEISFDNDFVSEGRFASIERCIARDLSSEKFRFLDVGGGNGSFTDRILERYPGSIGHLVDYAPTLIDRNVPHPRKTLHNNSVEELESIFKVGQFDLVFLNFALHHFVVGSYSKTRAMQRLALQASRTLLSSGGRLSIVENLCDGYAGSLSSRIIYFATSSKRFAPIFKRLGANTAGTGVCFLGRTDWRREIEGAGFSITHFEQEDYPNSLSGLKKAALLMRDWRAAHFWAEPHKT